MSTFLERVVSLGRDIIRSTDMGYTSLVFMGCLIGFFLVYFLLRSQHLKLLWILFANLIFYAWAGNLASLIIVCATAVIVYLTSRRMETVYGGYETESKDLSPKERVPLLAAYKKKTRVYLYLALFLILAVWIYVKVGKLLDFSEVGRFQNATLFTSVIVPLGISYYSLSSIGYLLDVYWQKTRPEHNFLALFTVMTYFPHIVEGPISKYQKLIDQVHQLPTFDYTRVCHGLQLMLWGYFKKMVVADRLAIYTEAVFADPTKFAGLEILLAVFFCAFQLYTDFSGCMDIVEGISEVLGLQLEQNFRQPFFAKSAAEFWRRWHITLGNWTREYLYMPIATNPHYMKTMRRLKKKWGAYLGSLCNDLPPMLVVWIFTGLWHGSGWSYIVWGLYWFVLMMLSQVTKPLVDRFVDHFSIQRDRWYCQGFQMIKTFSFFAIGRMFTVAGSLTGCGLLWKQLFSAPHLHCFFDGTIFTYGLDRADFCVAFFGIIMVLLIDFFHERGIKIRERIAGMPLVLRWAIYYVAIFVIIIFGIYGSGYDAASFIYGSF